MAYSLPGKLGAFSDAHSIADVKEMKKATESLCIRFKEIGKFFISMIKEELWIKK